MKDENRKEMMEYLLKLLPLINKRFLREDELFKSDNLFPSHIQILLVLSEQKQMTMSEISRSINVINSNLTPLVDKLIKLNYLKRQPSKKDRRVVYISLTTSGKHYVEEHKKYVKTLLDEKFTNLTEDQKVALLDHIKGLYQIILESMGEIE